MARILCMDTNIHRSKTAGNYKIMNQTTHNEMAELLFRQQYSNPI